MKKTKVLLALASLMCFVLLLGACGSNGKELKFTDVIAGGVEENQAFTSMKELTALSGFDGNVEFNGKYATTDEIKTQKVKIPVFDSETVKYTLNGVEETEKNVYVSVLYDASTGTKLKETESSYAYSIAADGKSYTQTKTSYYSNVDKFLNVEMLINMKMVETTVYYAEGGNESDTEYSVDICYLDGAEFLTFDNLEDVVIDDDLGLFYGINGTYYYEKDGKLVEGFKEDPVFGNKKNIAKDCERLGDKFYVTSDSYRFAGVVCYNSALEEIARVEVESYKELVAAVILPDGNVLVQTKTVVPQDGSEYSYYCDGNKYLVETVILDTDKNKTKKTDCAYLLEDDMSATAGLWVNGEKTEIEIAADGVNCVAFGREIKEIMDEDSETALKLLVIGDDGKIKGHLADLVENQVGDIEPISDGRYMVGDVTGKKFLIDEKGNVVKEVINYYNVSVPSGEFRHLNDYYYRLDDGEKDTLYSISGEKFVLKDDSVSYTIVDDSSYSVLVKNDKDKYFFIYGTEFNVKELTAAADETITRARIRYGSLIVVEYTKTVGDNTYEGTRIYNICGEKLGEFVDTDEYSVNVSDSVDDDFGVIEVEYNYKDPSADDVCKYYVLSK